MWVVDVLLKLFDKESDEFVEISQTFIGNTRKDTVTASVSWSEEFLGEGDYVVMGMSTTITNKSNGREH